LDAGSENGAGTASGGRDVPPTISVVVVTHDSAAEIGRSLPAIAAQLREDDELIVCDNASTDGTPQRVGELAPGARLIETGANLGFGAACNLGADAAGSELLLFLNPDALVADGFREAIELPLLEGRGWGAWQGLVIAGDGATVNSRGGAVHFTGIAWADGAGRPLAEAPDQPCEVTFASGACLAVPRAIWLREGGFSAPYFLYHEDTELGLRLRLAGEQIGLEPRARCTHEYEFAKGPHKWFYLERNRWATLIRTYPSRLLAAIAPALLLSELALLAVAALGGWLPEKLRATRAAAAALPRLRAERAVIQSRRRIGAAELAELLTPDLDSAYLGRAGRSPLLRTLLRAYWALARRML
jgi:N-acetylglucosaminyl-diphospho-decaprenol L-rhamnosyltransferase